MLIAARFSGPGSGKDLLSRAISLIASGLLPFSSFPIPVAPEARGSRAMGSTGREATTQPLRRLPCDATYQRVRAYLRRVMDEPVFTRPGQEPGDRR